MLKPALKTNLDDARDSREILHLNDLEIEWDVSKTVEEILSHNDNVEEYKNYLEKSLEKLNKRLFSVYEKNLSITSDLLLDELRFWEVKDFVWPNILVSPDASIIFYWKSGSLNLRFERFNSDEALYRISFWDENNLGKTKKKQSIVSFLEHKLPIIYQHMINKANESGVDWKEKFVKVSQNG